MMTAADVSLKESPYLDSIVHNLIANTLLVCQISSEGIYEYVGKTHRSILGYNPEELIGRSLFDFIHAEDLAISKLLFRDGLNTGYFNKIHIRYRCNNNNYLYLESQGIAIYDENNCVSGAVFVTRDITYKNILENELARLGQLKSMAQLSAGLVHEIRNPITTVRGFLQILYGNEELKQFRDYFELMIKELDDANHLITDYLSLSKDNHSHFAWQNLNSLIHSSYSVMNAEAMMNNHKIILDLGEINDLYMDGNQIRQLLINLVNNGLEAMESGGILTIRTASQGEYIVLSVEDKGSGIDSEIMNRIGTPFFTTKEKGTGLGLSICKNIADKHKAEIKIKSSTDGTMFSVWFKDLKAVDYNSVHDDNIFAVE
jgi:PAS domain S-box-containing protein